VPASSPFTDSAASCQMIHCAPSTSFFSTLDCENVRLANSPIRFRWQRACGFLPYASQARWRRNYSC
jgi:hypothetical protein